MATSRRKSRRRKAATRSLRQPLQPHLLAVSLRERLVMPSVALLLAEGVPLPVSVQGGSSLSSRSSGSRSARGPSTSGYRTSDAGAPLPLGPYLPSPAGP